MHKGINKVMHNPYIYLKLTQPALTHLLNSIRSNSLAGANNDTSNSTLYLSYYKNSIKLRTRVT
jgi:hypothetical protein